MKSTILTLSLLTTFLQIQAQDFTLSPYQDYGLFSTILADFNGDQKTDILGNHYVGGLAYFGLLVNDGSTPLSFSEKNTGLNLVTGGQPTAVDIDGDSDLDVIVGKGSAYSLFLLRNDGAGNFTADSLGVSGSNLLKVADSDNDGDLDIIGVNTNTNKLRVYVNNGSLHFTAKIITIPSLDLVAFDAADMDNDGDIDIVLGFDNFTDLHIAVYKNNGGNTFESVTVAYNSYSSIGGLVIDDINSDGKKDIVAIKAFSCDAFVNQGSLSFSMKNLVSPGQIINSVATGDYNGDGRRDIVLGKNSTDITWHKNLSNANLSFESHTVGGVTPCYAISSDDLDNDGDEDLVVDNGDMWWYENMVTQEQSGAVDFSDLRVNVSPNPFTDQIRIENRDQAPLQVKVTDNMGRIVYAATLSSEIVDLSGLNPGVYFLSVVDGASREVRSARIVKGL